MKEQARVMAGTVVGALVGAATAYLFFTESGRQMRARLEPAVEDLRRDFARFQKTLEKVGDMANEGLRVVDEFKLARGQSPFSTGTTAH